MNVLFLDDRLTRHRLFAAECPEAEQVHTADECIQSLRAEPWDLVFLDHDLNDEPAPGVADLDQNNGLQVARWIVDYRPQIGRIVIHSTNLARREEMRRLLAPHYRVECWLFEGEEAHWRALLQQPADFRRLSTKSFDRAYYEQHRAEGLDYLHYADWQFRYTRWLKDCLRPMPAGENIPPAVLDVGCACGNMVQGFFDQGCGAAGCDVNEYMIGLGRERFPAIAEKLAVCDAANLHLYSAESFSLVHTMQSAEHWPADAVPRILRELWRVTQPGGLFWCVLDTVELEERQGRDLAAEDPTHVCIRPFAWWRDQLRAAGWQIVSEQFRHGLSEHGWSYFDSHDWDWWVARKGPHQSADPLLACEEWFVRADFAFADHHIIDEVAHGNCYELSAEMVNPGDVVIDVGACIGAFAALVHKLQPLARVFVVEANPRNIGCLAANAPHATIVPAALTYCADPALLNSVFPGSRNTGISRVRPHTEVVGFYGDGWTKPDLAPLARVTLEDLLTAHGLDQVDLLKLDCEGSEWDIFEHCTCLDCVRRIVGEWHGPVDEFEKLLVRRLPVERWTLRLRPATDGQQGLFWAQQR